eukprot:COSAG05_NODE_1713_length_4230_cov_3.216897_3_plen_309_part_00
MLLRRVRGAAVVGARRAVGEPADGARALGLQLPRAPLRRSVPALSCLSVCVWRGFYIGTGVWCCVCAITAGNRRELLKHLAPHFDLVYTPHNWPSHAQVLEKKKLDMLRSELPVLEEQCQRIERVHAVPGDLVAQARPYVKDSGGDSTAIPGASSLPSASRCVASTAVIPSMPLPPVTSSQAGLNSSLLLFFPAFLVCFLTALWVACALGSASGGSEDGQRGGGKRQQCAGGDGLAVRAGCAQDAGAADADPRPAEPGTPVPLGCPIDVLGASRIDNGGGRVPFVRYAPFPRFDIDIACTCESKSCIL